MSERRSSHGPDPRPVADIAHALGKSEGGIEAASDELVDRGVCRRGLDLELEIADRYWPYQKQPSGSGPQEYVAQIRKLLSEPACVRCRSFQVGTWRCRLVDNARGR